MPKRSQSSILEGSKMVPNEKKKWKQNDSEGGQSGTKMVPNGDRNVTKIDPKGCRDPKVGLLSETFSFWMIFDAFWEPSGVRFGDKKHIKPGRKYLQIRFTN